jgi:hypothetical protein
MTSEHNAVRDRVDEALQGASLQDCITIGLAVALTAMQLLPDEDRKHAAAVIDEFARCAREIEP